MGSWRDDTAKVLVRPSRYLRQCRSDLDVLCVLTSWRYLDRPAALEPPTAGTSITCSSTGKRWTGSHHALCVLLPSSLPVPKSADTCNQLRGRLLFAQVLHSMDVMVIACNKGEVCRALIPTRGTDDASVHSCSLDLHQQ